MTPTAIKRWYTYHQKNMCFFFTSHKTLRPLPLFCFFGFRIKNEGCFNGFLNTLEKFMHFFLNCGFKIHSKKTLINTSIMRRFPWIYVKIFHFWMKTKSIFKLTFLPPWLSSEVSRQSEPWKIVINSWCVNT